MAERQEPGATRAGTGRRRLLGWIGGGTATALLTACGGPPVSPTVAPPAGGTPPVATATRPLTAATPDTATRITGPYDGEARALTGAGATFPAILYTKWFSEYEKLTGVRVNYQSIGSGAGIQNFQRQTVDFGATDAYMSDQRLAEARGGPALHVATAIGGVSVTYNVPGLASTDSIQLTGDTLAAIFLGEIETWNDPRLVADNPALAAIHKPIIVLRRSDSSGTTAIFTDYLATISDAWKTAIGAGTAVSWPVGLGAKGNEGITGEVKQNPNSIGYVEQAFALQNRLAEARIRNQAGRFVAPSLPGLTAAAAAFAPAIPDDLRVSIVNAPGADSYPVAGFTWLLAYQQQPDRAKGIALSRLLWWSVTDAQQHNEPLHYGRLPPDVVAKCQVAIRSMTHQGAPIFPSR